MNRLYLDLQNDSESLKALRVFVEKNTRRAGFEERHIRRIELALEEATINIIKHAYGGRGGRLEFCCSLVKGNLEISLADEGPPFNPLEVPGPDAITHIASQKIGGMGIHLMRNMADTLRYRREKGRNVLTLCFHRKSGTAP